MNPMDIMKGLNGIKDSFIMDAQDFRQGKRKVRHIPHKKLWLIAAIIALALLLVGCTVVYVLRLQDLAFGQDTQEVLGSGRALQAAASSGSTYIFPNRFSWYFSQISSSLSFISRV